MQRRTGETHLTPDRRQKEYDEEDVHFGSSAGDMFVSACVPECASVPECTGFYALQVGPPAIQTHQGFPILSVLNSLHGRRGDKN